MNELKYLNICYDENEHDEKLNSLISFYSNKIFKYSCNNELMNLVQNQDIHLLIIKNNFELLKKIRLINKQIQIIVFLDELNKYHLLNALELQYIKFIKELKCVNEFIYILKDCIRNIDSKKSNILKLKNDFIYDHYNKTLFKKNEIISLTKKESLFLAFLIKESDKAIDYNQINKEIWNNAMSQDALRSVIKEIRKKTYKELIKNISGMGYRIDL